LDVASEPARLYQDPATAIMPRARTEFNPAALNLYVVEGFNKVLVNLISGKFIHLAPALTNAARVAMLKIKLIIRRVY